MSRSRQATSQRFKNIESTMETIDFLLAEVLAQRAVLNALVTSHPDKAALRESIRECSVSLSMTSLRGDPPGGVQMRFDRLIEQFQRLAKP